MGIPILFEALQDDEPSRIEVEVGVVLTIVNPVDAWGPWYEWPDPVDTDKRQSYFDFEL